ncbi:anthranilate synthase component I family protein [Hydrogenivirga sp. 128-5-R1-1]|uniref:chorismate-binding protein n=1 Tax=Hydrogenivirga sp. 128-5-R1-1 TaxID=392423 RepID=UPI00015EF7EF|nr:anthranilate synthase component I family protein [Hydrogenivirga sp. 128-5-R1-1]EDP74935.1 p-aminobenzoate synthetase [Hydrogenivirga sp. 128-5-R1-1]
MRLVVSGGWFGRDGLWEVEVLDVLYSSDLSEIEGLEGFVLISYDLTTKALGVPVKERGLPPVVFLKTGRIKPCQPTEGGVDLDLVGMSLGEEEFKEKIERVKDFIASGDVYQINLTSEMRFGVRGSLETLFFKFHGRQPVPYSFYLDTGDLCVLSGSMELFLKKNGDIIESKPIKGTGRSAEEILASEKERAENLMITDMVRNDLGRVAETGSVRVEDLFRVEWYETLYQMHSRVVARTRESFSAIIENTFPPASVTGAPKYRAVQIIDELEPHARGYYCGCAGFVKEDGDFTLSVLIRTAFGGGEEVSYFAGCGIVWDSDPEKEWRELLLKTRAFYP